MEQILEPDLPIVDPHHHLWDFSERFKDAPPPSHPFDHVGRLSPRYLIEELSADLRRGHNVRATVYMECGAMYRADGPDAFKPVGETEFVNGVAAMSASGIYGTAQACAAIVGHADLRAGSSVAAVLEAHIARAHLTTPTPMCWACWPIQSRTDLCRPTSAGVLPSLQSSASPSTPGSWSLNSPRSSTSPAHSRRPRSSSTMSARPSASASMRAAASNASTSGASLSLNSRPCRM